MIPDPSKQEIVANLVDIHLSSGQHVRFWVTSNSMYPLLQIGDAVIVETASHSIIKPGDVLVLQRDHDYLTHRFIGKSGKKWFTKGDNNVLPDPPFSMKEITGKVIYIQRSERIVDLQTRKWLTINSLVAKLSFLEWKVFSIHRYLRLPFRLTIKSIQKVFMSE